jgi:hypothetical protein
LELKSDQYLNYVGVDVYEHLKLQDDVTNKKLLLLIGHLIKEVYTDTARHFEILEYEKKGAIMLKPD